MKFEAEDQEFAKILRSLELDLETWQEKLEIVFCCNNCLDLSWQKVSQFLKKGPQVRGQRLIICDLSYLDTVPSQENQVTK